MAKQTKQKNPNDEFMTKLIELGNLWEINPKTIGECINAVYNTKIENKNGGN
tara:strand:+ start:726 stop:881 length:156 start_codon:yes stop_codon:yes gene_type:complete